MKRLYDKDEFVLNIVHWWKCITMLGYHLVLVTTHCGLQLVLSKDN